MYIDVYAVLQKTRENQVRAWRRRGVSAYFATVGSRNSEARVQARWA